MNAILALSADPITNGHIDVIKRAMRIVSPNEGSLTVAIGINPDKKYTFDLKTREDLAKKALQGMDVKVVSFSGLLVDFAKLNCITTIVRSVRDGTDFNYEKMLHDINVSQEHGVDTIVFFARQELTHISSSAVKELQKNHGSIVEYVPLGVKEALERQISGQFLLGVTGEIGAGKSFVTTELMQYRTIRNIDMDVLGRKILTEYAEPIFVETRAKLLDKIGLHILQDQHGMTIDPKKLTNCMFRQPRALAHFNEIMLEPTLLAFRRSLVGLKGVIFVNSALLAEANLSYLTNNNILLIKSDRDTRIKRLEKRGYAPEEIGERISAQMNAVNKLEVFDREIGKAGHGKVITFDNTNPTKSDFYKLSENLKESFSIWA